MSPQQMVAKTTNFDIRQLVTLGSLFAIVAGVTMFVDKAVWGTGELEKDLSALASEFKEFAKERRRESKEARTSFDRKLDGMEDSFTGQMAEMNARHLNHDSKDWHEGANTRLTVLEHRINRQDQAFEDLNKKLDIILSRVGVDSP